MSGFVGADPVGLRGLAGTADHYALRVRAAGREVVGLLNSKYPLGTGDSIGWALSSVERHLTDEADGLRWRATAIEAAQEVNVGSSQGLQRFLRDRAEFAALAVFDVESWRGSYGSWRRAPDKAELIMMSPAEVSVALGSVSPAVAGAFARKHPQLTGGLDGAPPYLRYMANRLLIEREIEELNMRIAELQAPRDGLLKRLDPGHLLGWPPVAGPADLEVRYLRQQMKEYQLWLDEHRQILLFDPAGDGRVVEVFGDLAAAAHVGVVVPGITNDLGNFSGGGGGFRANAAQLHDASTDLGGDDVATIAWLGYDTPDSADATLRGAARSGAPALVQFLEGIDPDAGKQVTLIAHSYGSVVAGVAAAGGIEADNLVFVGSPGTTLDHADDAVLRPNGRVWAALAKNDPIEFGVAPQELLPFWLPFPITQAWSTLNLVNHSAAELWHGTNPTSDDFGAIQITTDGSSGHSGYFEAGSLTNLARIVQGRDAEVELVD